MTNQGNLKIGGLGHHQEIALMDWEMDSAHGTIYDRLNCFVRYYPYRV